MPRPDPAVSIITPAYNAARFIEETIQSVLSQSYTDWEMIIVDDCSRDDTRVRIETHAQRDKRIRLIAHQTNGGPSAARNTALKAASGRYIAFLDSDDLWLPGKLQTQLDFMRDQACVFSFTAFRRISEDGSGCGRLIGVPNRLNYRQLLKNTAIATSTVIVDRRETGPFEMIRTYYDDYALWLSLLRRGVVACGFNQDLMRYRVVQRSVSRHKANSALWVWRTYRDIEHLSLPDATWCFMNYAVRAYLKYASF